MTRRRLVVFVRAPRLGAGKRRLAREIGDVAAVRFERLMIALLLRRLGADRRWRLRIAITPDHAHLHVRRLHRRPVETVAQGRGDLGVRMQRSLRACARGPVVLVGSDIPALGAAEVAAAFRLLGGHDLVFGRAEDGGFWLVGARNPQRFPKLFKGVRWSTPYALADTLAGLPRLASVGFAALLCDVDDAESYRRLAPPRGF
jgi:rSAM/selenodomain-associated transferase 1